MTTGTTLVVLAAGRGSRMGRMRDVIHKGLLPLGGKAAISHIIDNAPHDTVKTVVVVGDRADEVTQYVCLAHPDIVVEFVKVDIDEPRHGPGVSARRGLLARSPGTDVVISPCDTVVRGRITATGTWVGVAPRPAGTQLSRWCRMWRDEDGVVTKIVDKTSEKAPDDVDDTVYTGLCRLAAKDVETFCDAIDRDIDTVDDDDIEVRDIWGFDAFDQLRTLDVDWVDIGDDESYTRAVRLFDGYDWSKPSEITYVLPHNKRVVKFWPDHKVGLDRLRRGMELSSLKCHPTPKIVGAGVGFMAYDFVPGVSLYEAIETEGLKVVDDFVNWYLNFAQEAGHIAACVDGAQIEKCSAEFYSDKTYGRLAMLKHASHAAHEIVGRIDWEDLIAGTRPSVFHGDLAFGNVIVSRNTLVNALGMPDFAFTAIDWRESFGGQTMWGDARYDVAKMFASCEVQWENARHGDFTPWALGPDVHALLSERLNPSQNTLIIAALSLLNSAPLHASPLDEVLVARGTAWLERLL